MSLEKRAISTTVSCTVSSGEGHLSAEVDSRAWGYNGGRSQYFEGDNCYVIVYISSNTDIIGSMCSNNSSWGSAGGDVGYNVHRESIAFSTPIAHSSKPIGSYSIIHPSYNGCSNPNNINGTTIFRMGTWNPTLSISAVPTYGFIFISYTPICEMWAFRNLAITQGLISTEVHGALFGLVSAYSSS